MYFFLPNYWQVSTGSTANDALDEQRRMRKHSVRNQIKTMTFNNMNLLTEWKSGMQKYLTPGLVFNYSPGVASSVYHDWEPWVFSCLPQSNSVKNCFITWPSIFLFFPFPFWLTACWAVWLFSSPALHITLGIFEECEVVYESYDKFNSEMLSQTTKNHQVCYNVYTSW